MFDKIGDWLFNRALRISTANVKWLASKTGQSAERIVAVNDAVAGIAAHEAVQAVQKAAEKVVPQLVVLDGLLPGDRNGNGK